MTKTPHNQATDKTVLLYDGACHLCSREITLYKKHNTGKTVGFVDISAAGFDACAWGVDPKAVHKHMHVRRPDGTFAKGLDAFVAVWQVLPGYKWLARVAQTPGVASVLRAGYRIFAELRPYLPKRRQTETTCEVTF